MEKYQVKSTGREPLKPVKGNEVLGTLNYPSTYNRLKQKTERVYDS